MAIMWSFKAGGTELERFLYNGPFNNYVDKMDTKFHNSILKNKEMAAKYPHQCIMVRSFYLM